MQEAVANGDMAAVAAEGDAGRALEERARVQRLLQAAQDGDLESLKVDTCPRVPFLGRRRCQRP